MEPFRQNSEVIVHHQKPWKRGPPIQMRGFVQRFDGTELVLRRAFRNPGRPYDGLGASQQVGDHGLIHLRRGAWVCRRQYFRASGELIGELYNIQTATEFAPGNVRYEDLEIDVAYVPSAPVPTQIHDVVDLERAMKAGHISAELGRIALGLAASLAERIGRWNGRGDPDWDVRPEQLPATPPFQIGAH